MSNNITGSAAGWIESKESNSITERSNKIVSYTDVTSQLNALYTIVKSKYEIKPSKNVYDSLVSIKSAINALLLN